MYKNGDRLGWNADHAIRMFIKYPDLKEANEQLQSMVARNQAVAKKHAERITQLERELRSTKESSAQKVAELVRRIRALTEQIKRESTAA